MKLDVYTSKGSKSKKSAELNDAVFGIEPNDHAIYLDVKRYLASKGSLQEGIEMLHVVNLLIAMERRLTSPLWIGPTKKQTVA